MSYYVSFCEPQTWAVRDGTGAQIPARARSKRKVAFPPSLPLRFRRAVAEVAGSLKKEGRFPTPSATAPSTSTRHSLSHSNCNSTIIIIIIIIIIHMLALPLLPLHYNNCLFILWLFIKY
jgi:hypothetical protein